MSYNNNNLKQGLIKIKRMIIPVIKTLRQRNKFQVSSGRYLGKNALLPTLMKAGGIFLMSGVYEAGQQATPTNIPGPQ